MRKTFLRTRWAVQQTALHAAALRLGTAILLILITSGCHTARQPVWGVDELLAEDVEAGNIGGAVVQIARNGEILHRSAHGFAQRYEFGGALLHPPENLTAEHVFDLASLTKVFGTTMGVMLLVDRGVVDLDAPVRRYLPEFSSPSKDSVTVRHLLTHTGGLSRWEPIYYHASTPAETYAYISRLPLQYAVGEARRYSDLGFMLLGFMIERLSGASLDTFLEENIYNPLALENTGFNPLERGIEPTGIAATSHGNPFERQMVYDDSFGYEVDEDPTSWDGWRQYTLRGEVNDGNAFYANSGIAGHAGLFSTVDDLQKMVDLLLDGGGELIGADVVASFLTRDEHGNGLGWAMDPGIIRSRGAPEGTFGHTGFTGTSVVVIPEYDTSIILLTNRQHVGRRPDGTYYDLNPTRQRLVSLVLDALGS